MVSRPARRTIGWHRIIFFTFLFTSELLPPGRPPARLHFPVFCRTRRFAFLTQSKKEPHWLLRSSLVLLVPLLFLSLLARSCLRATSGLPRAWRAQSLDGISFESLATRSPFNVTKDPTFSTHITPFLVRYSREINRHASLLTKSPRISLL